MGREDLKLRKMNNQDIPLVEKWLNKKHVRKWFGDPGEWLNEIYNREGQYDWINHYIIEYEDKPMGFCQYYDCSKTGEGYGWDNESEGTFGIDYLIGNEEFLGKGIGKQIVNKLTQMVIENENPTQIIADPLEGNSVSRKVLEYNDYFWDDLKGLYKFIR